jgi:acetyl-CoA acetyltransferase
MAKIDNPIAFVGCGYTELTRKPTVGESELAVSACRQAANDAGLDPSEIDGINVQVHHYPPPDSAGIARGLGMKEIRWQEDGGLGVPSAARAAQALDARLCDAIVVCKIMNTIAPVSTPAISAESGGVAGPAQFEVPFGLGYTMQRTGLASRRWMNRYGITAEQIGWLCVTQREHAMLNPRAYFQTPLTIDDYLSSRWIADPVHLLDCDFPVNGAYAYVMTRGDQARCLAQPPVYLLSWAESLEPHRTAHLLPEELDEGPSQYLRPMYSDAKVGPDDLDVWMLYDGFSFFALQWMESLGLVPRGEAGHYVEGGKRIRFDGEHPVNTHGGQLSEGRLHAAGHILEAIQQLRGAAGPRQATKADHAVVTTASANTGAAAILGRG